MVQRGRRQVFGEPMKVDKVGPIIESISGAIGQAGDAVREAELKQDTLKMSSVLNNANNDVMIRTEKYKLEAEADPFNQDIEKKYNQDVQKIYGSYQSQVPQSSVMKYNESVIGLGNDRNTSLTEWRIGRDQKNTLLTATQSIERNTNTAYTYGKTGDIDGAMSHYKQSSAILDLNRGMMTPEEESKLLGGYESDYMVKFTEGSIQDDPDQALALLDTKELQAGIGSEEKVDMLREKAYKRKKGLEKESKVEKNDADLAKLEYTKDQADEVALDLNSDLELFNFASDGEVKNKDLNNIKSLVSYRNEVKKHKNIMAEKDYNKAIIKTNEALYRMADKKYGKKKSGFLEEKFFFAEDVSSVGSQVFKNIESQMGDFKEGTEDDRNRLKADLFESTYQALLTNNIDLDDTSDEQIQASMQVSENIMQNKMKQMNPGVPEGQSLLIDKSGFFGTVKKGLNGDISVETGSKTQIFAKDGLAYYVTYDEKGDIISQRPYGSVEEFNKRWK